MNLIRLSILLAVTLMAGSCTRASSTGRTQDGASGPARAAAANPWRAHSLWVERGGQTRPLENGAVIALDHLSVEVFLAPFPPLREGSIDLYITETASHRPLEETVVRVVFDMIMPHGTIPVRALPLGGGHFLVPYKLVMPGEWRADVTLTYGNGDNTLGLLFRVD